MFLGILFYPRSNEWASAQQRESLTLVKDSLLTCPPKPDPVFKLGKAWKRAILWERQVKIAKKIYTAEQIINMLRAVEVLISQVGIQ